MCVYLQLSSTLLFFLPHYVLVCGEAFGDEEAVEGDEDGDGEKRYDGRHEEKPIDGHVEGEGSPPLFRPERAD